MLFKDDLEMTKETSAFSEQKIGPKYAGEPMFQFFILIGAEKDEQNTGEAICG